MKLCGLTRGIADLCGKINRVNAWTPQAIRDSNQYLKAHKTNFNVILPLLSIHREWKASVSCAYIKFQQLCSPFLLRALAP